MTEKQTTVESVEMTPEQIAAAERENQALLAKLAARAKDEGLAVEDGDAASSPRSSQEIAAEIERAKLEQDELRRRAEITMNERIADLVREKQRAEDREARRPNINVADRLRAAADVVARPIEDDRARAAERERADLQKQADKVIADAQEALDMVDEIMEEHGSEIDRLSKISDDDWLKGLPAEGPNANRAYSLARRAPVMLDDLNAYVKNSRRAVEKLTQELQQLVRTAPLPAAKDTARWMSWSAAFNEVMRDLGRMGGTVPTVNGMISNLSLIVADLAALREQYTGSAQASVEFVTESPTKVIRDMDKPNPNAPQPASYKGMAQSDLWR